MANSDLLVAIIGAISTVWAISFAAYIFIWEYFDRKIEKQTPTEDRLKRNLRAFLSYLVGGILTFITILTSVVVLFAGESVGTLLALIFFIGTLAFFLLLFSFEIFTSIRNVWRRLQELKDPREPGHIFMCPNRNCPCLGFVIVSRKSRSIIDSNA